MRDLKHFRFKEWLQMLPLQLAFKQMRNDAWLRYYKGLRPPELGPFLKAARALRGRDVALVVAFEQPWALDWLLRMAERNLAETAFVVLDNSRRSEARQEIAEVCRKRGILYLGLPPNPTRHVNRSHGMAMTWIYHNVVRAIEPRLFAFIDHDMIPVVPVNLAARLGEQPFYGMETHSGPWAWNLWAGYCMFDFARLAGKKMNFLYDFSRGLDTGGRNWGSLYRHFDPTQLRFANSIVVDVQEPKSGASGPVQLVDEAWLHIGGISYNDNFRTKAEFCQLLAEAMDEGTPWSQLCLGISAQQSFKKNR